MLYKIFRTLKSILIINFKIIYFKIINSKKKILIFYHPKKKLTNISVDHIEFLFSKNNKFNVIFCIGHEDANFTLNNYFFVSQRFLHFLPLVDFFLSSYVCDNFPKNCKKIYIHHDIYDTPVVDNKIQKNFLMRLKKYDFILLPNQISINYFKIILKKNKIKNKLVFENVGYLKLQYLKKIKKRKSLNLNKVVIAPTNIYSFGNLTIYPNIRKIISFLLNNTNYNIILRPHPSNREDSKFLKIKKIFENNSRFTFDDKKNYYQNYLTSDFMITDMSGTAYTYSFFTYKPVIFFVNLQEIKKKGFQKLNYFKNIKKIGYQTNNLPKLKNIIKKMKRNNRFKLRKIVDLESKIFSVKNSKKKILKILNNC